MPDPEPSWLSPLGGAVLAFLASSAVYALIAVAGLVLTHRHGVGRVPGSPSIFLSADVEEEMLGRSPADLMRGTPGLARILGLIMDAFLGMMLGFAVLLASIAWFGLREGQDWALWAAVLGNTVMLGIYWGVAIGPFLRETGVGYIRIWHPYALVPSVLVPIGTILGWIGLVRA